MSNAGKNDWRRSLPWVVIAWLYFPFLIFAVPLLNKTVSENVFGLVCTVSMLIPAAGIVPWIKGWMSGSAVTWLITLPYSALLIVIVVLIES